MESAGVGRFVPWCAPPVCARESGVKGPCDRLLHRLMSRMCYQGPRFWGLGTECPQGHEVPPGVIFCGLRAYKIITQRLVAQALCQLLPIKWQLTLAT